MGLIHELLDIFINVRKRDYKSTVAHHRKLELLLQKKLAQAVSPADYANSLVEQYRLLPQSLKVHLYYIAEKIITSSGLYGLPLLPEYEDTEALYQHREYLQSMDKVLNSFDDYERYVLRVTENVIDILLETLPAPPSTDATELSFDIPAMQYFHHSGSDVLDKILGNFFSDELRPTAVFATWRIIIINNFISLYDKHRIKGTEYTADILKTKVESEALAHAIFTPLPLTNIFDFVVSFALPPENRFNHQYVLGKTGSGKSVLLRHQIAHDLNAGYGVVVMTPEQDLINDVLSYVPASRKEDVVYFNPADGTFPIVGFNPFGLSDKTILTQRAGELESILIRTVGDMGVKMKPVLSNSIYALLATQGTFNDIPKLLDPDDASYRHSIIDKLDERTREFFKKYDTSKYYKDVYEPIINRLDPLLRPPLSTTLTTHALNFTDILNKNSNIVLCDLSRLRGFQAEIVGQLLLATFQQIVFARDLIPERDRLPYFFYMDEFQTYATINEQSLKEFLTRSRKYKLGIVMAHQNTDDIPSNLLSSIYGNCGTLTGMLMSAKDASAFTREAQLANFKGFAKAETQLQNFIPGEIAIATPDMKQAKICRVPEHPPFTRSNQQIESLKKYAKSRFGITTTPTKKPPKPPNKNKDDSDSSPPNDWDDLGYRLS